MNRIDALYQRTRSTHGFALNVYLCAGSPSLDATEALILEMERRGVDAIELGMPFSDPVADGPDLQPAHARGVAAGITLGDVLDLVRRVRRRSQVPIALMSYYNPIHYRGPARLVAEAAEAGVDGLIVPDLPPDEAAELIAAGREHDVKTVFFVAPTSTPDRVAIVNRSATGFIYCISVTGVTGARTKLPPELATQLRGLRRTTDKPLVVGFGVSTPEHVAAMAEVADGCIVGSAVARVIEARLGEPLDALLHAVGDFIEPLARAAHRSRS
ncbi:MAG TPA: tryptophan synthase subunit alpha [Planctomycetota bacterium]|nr:tryptophan synthase subunit alpha [Planctomycetota bacterium]